MNKNYRKRWRGVLAAVIVASGFLVLVGSSVRAAGTKELRKTPLIDDANLLHYYRLEDTSDSKGSLTLDNVGSSPFNNALFHRGWDGGTDNSSMGLGASSDYTGPITLSFWIKMNAQITSGYEMPICVGDSASLTDYQIQYTFDDFGQPGLEFRYQRQDVANDDVDWISPLSTSTFTLLTLTSDGTTLTGYVNGEAVGTTTVSSGSGSSGSVCGVSVGYYNGVGSPEYTNAIIDDAAVFSRALTPEEVSSLFTGDWKG